MLSGEGSLIPPMCCRVGTLRWSIPALGFMSPVILIAMSSACEILSFRSVFGFFGYPQQVT